MPRPAPRWAWAALALWVGVIVVVVTPWYNVQDHVHWASVQWIPFASAIVPLRDRIRDAVANTLFYLPFGYLALRGSPGRRVRDAVLAALTLSLVTEATQLYSHGRFPSTTDLLCNTLGACLGAVWADSRRDSHARDA